MKQYSNKEINACMKTIHEHCSDYDFTWDGETLYDYANTPDIIYLFRYLNEVDYISMTEKNGRPYSIRLTPKGLNYFDFRKKVRLSTLNSIIAVASGTVGGLTGLASFIMQFFDQ